MKFNNAQQIEHAYDRTMALTQQLFDAIPQGKRPLFINGFSEITQNVSAFKFDALARLQEVSRE